MQGEDRVRSAVAERNGDYWRNQAKSGQEILRTLCGELVGPASDTNLRRLRSPSMFPCAAQGAYTCSTHQKGQPSRVILPSLRSLEAYWHPSVGGTVLIGPTASPTGNKEDLDQPAIQLGCSAFGRMMVPRYFGETTSSRALRGCLGSVRTILIAVSGKRLLCAGGGHSIAGLTGPSFRQYFKYSSRRRACASWRSPACDPYVRKSPRARCHPLLSTPSLTQDPAYRRIVCRCERVAKRRSSRRPRGPHDLDASNTYTRSQQAAFRGSALTSIPHSLARDGMNSTSHPNGRGSVVLKGSL